MNEIVRERFYKMIGYEFKNPALLDQALTHRSAKGPSNERLEFLGDAILNCTIACKLYRERPNDTEGDLSRLRANLVKESALGQLARAFNLGDYIQFGVGELKSGGAYRESILADTLEAIIGAIFLDASIDVVQACILTWYQGIWKDFATLDAVKDPKTRLQEYLQAKRLSLPTYTIKTISGKDHDQQFRVECHTPSLPIKTEGIGTNRRLAEQNAAENFLKALKA